MTVRPDGTNDPVYERCPDKTTVAGITVRCECEQGHACEHEAWIEDDPDWRYRVTWWPTRAGGAA